MVYSRENFNQLLEEQTVSRSQIDQLKTENRLLQEKIQCLMKKLFGRSSEKLSPDQLELELEELRELQEALELAETKAELAEEEQKNQNAASAKGSMRAFPKICRPKPSLSIRMKLRRIRSCTKRSAKYARKSWMLRRRNSSKS
jgi:hypothetical protein